MNTVIRDFQTLFSLGRLGSLSDGQLLERFVTQREEAAFEAIVERHGPMVLGVCRRVLRNDHDAEDAFQTTFLVFSRKAGSVTPRDMVANWLYGVAYKTAMKARALTAKRHARERQVTVMPEPEAVSQTHGSELRLVLDQELSRLPGKYRVPIILCHLEGKTYREVAHQLGWPEGTLSGRLSRARILLAKRLTRRGLRVWAGSMAVLISQNSASASVPNSLMKATVKAASLLTTDQGIATGVISSKATALVQGVLKSMSMTNILKQFTVVMALVSGVTLLLVHNPRAEEGDKPPRMNTGFAQTSSPNPIKPVPPSPVRSYKIRWQVSQRGEKIELGSDTTAPEGQLAHLRLGRAVDSNLSSRADAPNGETVPLGFAGTATVSSAKNGKLCVDVRADEVERDQVEDGLQLRGETIRLIKVVDPGEGIQLQFRMRKKHQAPYGPTQLDLWVYYGESGK
jgi:RNA polymerase sigma factor (sigma-70 family)